MSLLPDAPGMELLHSRDYEIKVYRTSEAELLVHGAVSDRKPPGLYVGGDPDKPPTGANPLPIPPLWDTENLLRRNKGRLNFLSAVRNSNPRASGSADAGW